ncbi:MAG: hypothetical protein A2511_05135 [Deltaproteobacteria bacterium RIFOXYD12_FULL_50_9]|nr:MAG: hypothetical protein A2511_05135 [Deltaproteobacteria bacterium RIFOXYD12_FULL_50_9]
MRLAPVFDIVTTTAYIRNDIPALALAGAKKWWPRKVLEQFAIVHLSLPPAQAREIIDRCAAAVMETRAALAKYLGEHQEFATVSGRMLDIWRDGVEGLTGRT